MYTPYINYEEYISAGGSSLSSETAEPYFQKACRAIDKLTFNRINQLGGFDKLTNYQQEIIKEVVTNISDFYYENEDIIESIFNSYSINGVSMNFGNSWNITIENGVAIKSGDYELLSQAGLTTKTFNFLRRC